MPTTNNLVLYNFEPSEYGPTPHRDQDWWEQMDVRLVVLLDVFRQLWGRPVTISEHAIALGRHDGEDDTGDHNVDHHGAVHAADVFASIQNQEEAEEAVNLALDIGFTAVGLYPHWNGGIGLHLGTRYDQTPEDPATWGGVDRDGEQIYVSLDDALNEVTRG